MSTRVPTNERHNEASRRAAARSEDMWASLLERSLEEAVDTEGRPYSFSPGERFTLWCALGFLIAGDHELSGEECIEVIAHTVNMPVRWRNAIYRGGPSLDNRACHVITRDIDGSCRIRDIPVLGIVPRSEPDSRMDEMLPAAAAQGSQPDSVMVDVEGTDLLVLIARPSRARNRPLALLWWAAEDDEDFVGRSVFERDLGLGETLAARVPTGAARRTFCLISEID